MREFLKHLDRFLERNLLENKPLWSWGTDKNLRKFYVFWLFLYIFQRKYVYVTCFFPKIIFFLSWFLVQNTKTQLFILRKFVFIIHYCVSKLLKISKTLIKKIILLVKIILPFFLCSNNPFMDFSCCFWHKIILSHK